jgi:peptidyl-prolyl cis-trans isomerase C
MLLTAGVAMRKPGRRWQVAAVAGLLALAAGSATAAGTTPPGATPAGATPAGTTPAGTIPAGATPAGATPGKPAPQAASTPAATQSVAHMATLPPAISGNSDPMVASVEGHPIYLSDLGRAEQALPPNLRGMPFEALYPVLLERLVDHQALVMTARRMHLEDNPSVRQQIEEATDRVLEGALLARTAAAKVTEQAIRARYDALYANRPATEEVRASHILVESKTEALKLIAELKDGAHFAELAREYSKDPDGKKGGDLGFFTREQVWPAFADVAFSLDPGQVASEPVHNEFGWHVIKVDERRFVPPPTFAQERDAIRQQLLQAAVRAEVAKARGELDIREWNLDGSPLSPADQSGTPAAAAK